MTTTQLTPGKWRGLATTSNPNETFSILAFDQRGSYRRMLPDDTPYEFAVQMKSEITGHLSQYASAVLLDCSYGLVPSMCISGKSGLLMSLEASGYTGDSTYRQMEMIDGWDVRKIKMMGADAVKLLVYYHPYAGSLTEEIEALVRDVIEQCAKYDLSLYLEPMSYSIDANYSKDSAEFAATRPDVVRETAKRLSVLQPEILKLEFPVDAKYNTDEALWKESCAAITDDSSVPWVLLSAGVDFDTFEAQNRVACQAGASGFLAGRAIWKEAVLLPDNDRIEFIRTTATQRIQSLTETTTQYARPWTDYFELPQGDELWYEQYAE